MEKTFSELEQLGPSDLIAFINDCIQHDFNKLVQLLYRIDVSEAKLKFILQAHPNEDAGKLIAAVVIERLAATKKAVQKEEISPFAAAQMLLNKYLE